MAQQDMLRIKTQQLDFLDKLQPMSPFDVKNQADESAGGKASQRPMYMVDMFAGCGGLSLGFENEGFVPVFVNELNIDAMATYLKNRRHSLGGVQFSANNDLRCNDANDLVGKRLNQLIDDLAVIPELF